MLAILVGAVGDRPDLRAGDPAPAVEPKAEVESAAEATPVMGTDEGTGLGLTINPSGGERVKVFGDARVASGERAKIMVAVFGNGSMEGEVAEECVVVFGDAYINGRVGGDCVVVMGSAKLGPKAHIQGDCTVVGGKLERDPGATLRRAPTEVSFGAVARVFQPIGCWFKSGLLLGRPLPPGCWVAWVVVGLHLLIYLILVVLFPKPVGACVTTLNAQPVQAFLVGLLGLILAGPVLAILTASMVGLLIAPFIPLVLLALAYVGKAAVLEWMGLQLFRRVNPEANPLSLVAFLTGFAVLTLLYMVPLLGFVLWGVLLPFGLGAALMATFAAFRRNSPPGPAVPGVPVLAGSPLGAAPGGGLVGDAAVTPPPLAAPGGSPDPALAATLPRVGFWLRLGATLLDFVLLCWLIPVAGPFFLPAWLAYHVGMWAWKGTTIGGIVCHVKVIRLDGRPVDFGVSLIRALGSMLSLTVLCLGFFWAGWSRDRQAWHDIIAGTTIVRMPHGMSLV
jgi:uncharacterized RDD family membrane protein YckC